MVNHGLRSKAPVKGVIIGLLVAIVGGLIVGTLSYFVTQIGYVVIFFPIAVGYLIASILSHILKKHHVRHLLVASGLGLLMGMVTYGTYQVGRYIEFRQLYQDETYDRFILEGTFDNREEAETTIRSTDIDALMQEFMIQEYGQGGVIGYFVLRADAGENVMRAAGDFLGDVELYLNGTLLALNWLLELIIIMLFPALSAIINLSAPYCEETGQWREMKILGFVDEPDHDAFIQAIQQANYAEAHTYIHEDLDNVTIIVNASRCSETSADALLEITEGLGRDKEILVEETISGVDYQALTGRALL